MTLPLSAVVNMTVQVYKSLFVSDPVPRTIDVRDEVHLHHVAPALCRPADLAWEVDDVVLHAA